MSAHTPGPWLVATSNSWRRIMASDGRHVCQPVTQKDGHPDLHFSNGGQDGPDARLLSSAPELLAALKELIAAGDECVSSDDDVAAMLRFGKAHDAAREVIAKATGSDK